MNEYKKYTHARISNASHAINDSKLSRRVKFLDDAPGGTCRVMFIDDNNRIDFLATCELYPTEAAAVTGTIAILKDEINKLREQADKIEEFIINRRGNLTEVPSPV